MKKRKYSETERDEIIRTFKNRTISVREFAKQYGVSTTSVYAWMKDPITDLNTEPHELAYHQLKMRIDSAKEQLKIIKSCRFFAEVPLRTRIEEMRRLAEIYYPRTYANLDQLILEVSAYIEEYNAIRPHSFNGGLPPNKTEAEYWAKHPVNKDVSAETSGFDSAQATDIVQ